MKQANQPIIAKQHYPIMYVYTAWVVNNRLPLNILTMSVGLGAVILSITLAYACLKLYDEPIRKWLLQKYLTKVVKA